VREFLARFRKVGQNVAYLLPQGTIRFSVVGADHREATPAEIDELGKALLARVQEVSIISEERHEIADSSEAQLHQVRVEVPSEGLPGDDHELDELRGRLVEVSERWAQACIAERHVEVL
jgi:hypothetical protein